MPEVEDVQDIDFLPLGEEAPEQSGNSQQSNNNDADDDSKDTDNNIDDSNDGDKGQNNDQEDQDDSRMITDTGNTDSNDNEESSQKDQQEGSDDQDDGSDDQDSDQDEDVNIYQSMIDSAGVDFDDETVEQILSTEQDTQGFNKVADIIADKKAEARLSSLLEQNPHTARMLEYESSGGDPEKYRETYFPQTDYNEVEITEDDVDTQRAVVKQNLLQQGFDEEDVEAQVEELETAGILEQNAQRSLKALRKRQQQQVEEFEQEREKLIQQRQQQQQKQYEKTVEAIDQGNIEGVNIPDNKKDEFKKYIFEPVNEQGMTQAQIDSESLELPQRLLIAYLNFSGYKLDEFVKKQAKNSNTRNIKDAITKSNNKENLKGKSDSNNKNQTKGKAEDIVSPFI